MTEDTESVTAAQKSPSPEPSADKQQVDDATSQKSDRSRVGTPSERGDVDGEEVEDGIDTIQEEGQTEREDEELSSAALALKEELDKIKVEPPSLKTEPSEVFDPAEFPESYKENLPKEKLALAFAENFRRQYVHLYRDRKPLFLNPVNECGIEKFICTTVRPTQLSYKELYDWDGAADFVADYLDFVTLDPAHELPTRLLSPTTVLKRQKGNCFEYSTILCSFLIGAGYDAYIVSGYASREVCLMDETREICPMLKKKEVLKQEEQKKEQKKYTVKPSKDLRSKFELKMAAREVQTGIDEEEQQKREEEARQAELELPPPDSLHGLRVHSWVLVLEGKREVPESFFIEPLTGIAHSVTSDNYLGIESVWNHQNYWVNMQDCSEGVKKLRYDLGDCTLWEYMFPSDEKPKLQIPSEEDDLDDLDDEEDEEREDEKAKKHVDLPPSWIEPIKLSPRDFHMRCPHGKKTKLYKRVKLEKFAPYLMKDGLETRMSVYQDRELTDLKQVKEFYKQRKDQLQERIHNHRTGWITEEYNPGRHRCLREHQYRASGPGPENDRTMIFYDVARVDGLKKKKVPTATLR